MNPGVSIYQDTLSGQPLGTVTSDRIAVIEIAVFTGFEFYASVVVETGGNSFIRSDGFYDGKVAIGDGKGLVRSSELNAVSRREDMCAFSIDADASEPTRVVVGKFTHRSLDRKNVGGRVYADYYSLLSSLDASALALIAVGPRPFGTRHVLVLDKHSEAMFLVGDDPFSLQFLTRRRHSIHALKHCPATQ